MAPASERIGTLIVDDQPDIRLLLRMVIEKGGDDLYVTGEATSGAEAIEHAGQEDPRVIVLDQMMPDMNGIDAATAIRAERPGQVIILCSAYLDGDLIERARAAGISLCLAKTHLHSLPQLIRDASELDRRRKEAL